MRSSVAVGEIVSDTIGNRSGGCCAYRFRLVPGFNVTKEVLWTSGEFQLEVEAEEAVNVLHEVEQRGEFVLDL